MSSIISGYEYDIFISYRQKDNKHDGWVTEFVHNLKGELESTFKEDISVYFDINPHDGLLETHDVDASLKDKLKCLVFIPIISRTYCDPKSFAWEHEFKAFRDQASKDQFGIKVKLPNGNVANRVLPVQIHDLYPEDKATVEKELGGVLRAIEFIYKEPGVNKPLSAKDNEDKNTNKTNYRIQINKVANAIDEIIHGIRSIQAATAGKNQQSEHKVTIAKEGSEAEIPKVNTVSDKNVKRWLIAGLSAIFCIVCAFGILKVIERTNQAKDIANLEKSIAVLPFVNDSPDKENEYFCNGMMEEILNNLQKIKDFRVLSRTSVEQYRGTSKPTIPKIAKALDVNYIVEGSVEKYGNTFRLRVQLIAANNEKHLWGESYQKEIEETKDIFDVQSQIAQTIAAKLRASITPEERDLIIKSSTTNLSAYDFYQKGNEELRKYEIENNSRYLYRAKMLYNKSLECDSTFARAYLGLANVYSGKNWNNPGSYLSKNYLDSILILANIALSFDDQLAEAYHQRAIYYLRLGRTKEALAEWDKVLKYNPNFWQVYSWEAWWVYSADRKYMDFVKAIECANKVVSLNRDKDLSSSLSSLGQTFGTTAGFYDKAKYYYNEAYKLDRDSTPLLTNLGNLEVGFGNYEEAISLLKRSYLKDSSYSETREWLGYVYTFTDKYDESLKLWNDFIKQGEREEILYEGSMLRVALAYWETGNKKEAERWFNKQIKFGEESIELGRSYSAQFCDYDLAATYAFLGKKDKAYEHLRKFNQSRVFTLWNVTTIKNDPLFKSIRNEPEFQEIVKDMEAKYQAEHERVKRWLEEKGQL